MSVDPDSPQRVPPPARSRGLARTGDSGRAPWGRWANWIVGISAGVFLLISLGGYFYQRGQLAEIAAEHLRVMLSGPARLHLGVANRFLVRTTSVTGYPVPAHVEFALSAPDGRPLMAHKETADEQGLVQIAVTPEPDFPDQVRMEVVGVHAARTERIETSLAVAPMGCLTAICLDKSLYRPGETIRFRSLTLSRCSLAVERDLPVRFEVRTPGNALVPGSMRQGRTVRGVGCGEFALRGDLADGVYALVAISPEGRFPEARREFLVRADHPQRIQVDLEFHRDRYDPGDRVVADARCLRPDGKPAPKARWKALATLDAKPIHESAGETSAAGLLRVGFALPDQIGQGDARLHLLLEDGPLRETAVRKVPLHLGNTQLSFHPEGGELVAGIENRLYVAARDAEGKPIRLAGPVVDSQGRIAAAVETNEAGMGSFQLHPQAGEQYRLRVETPADRQDDFKLPPVVANHAVVLTTGLGVLEAGKPLEFNVRATAAGLPLAAVVSCRGIPIAHTAFVTNQGANTVTIPLDDAAAGVVRLGVYTYRASPPKLLAERLVYRRPQKRLHVQVLPKARFHAPGDRAEFALRVTDEQGNAAPALLGVGVSGLADPGATPASPASAMSQLMLLGELDDCPDIDNVESYLADDPKAAVALDLLLGTRIRREAGEATDRPAAQPGPTGPPQPAASAAPGPDVPPPLLFDNLSQLLRRYQQGLAAYRMNRTRVLNTLTALSFFGGIGLVVFVAMLSLLDIPCGLRLWAPSLGVAAVCVVIGAVLMNPERLKPNHGAAVPFVSFELRPEANEAPSAAASATRGPSRALAPFAAPDYAYRPAPSKPATADHALETLLWRPLLSSDAQGQASEGVSLPERPGRYRVLVDAIGEDGRIGAAAVDLSARIPFDLEAPGPAQLTVGDRIDVPLSILNVSNRRLPVELLLEPGPRVRLEGSAKRNPQLDFEQRATEVYALHAAGPPGDCPVLLRAQSGPWAETRRQGVVVRPAGFPWQVSRAGRLAGREDVTVLVPSDPLTGSLQVQLRLFPGPLAEVLAAMEALSDVPAACFEQVVSTAGVAGLCLRQLADLEAADPSLVRRAKESLRAAASRWPGFASPSGACDWFGSDPGQEPLTAFALWQLDELAEVYPIWTASIPRVAKWLTERRDGPARAPAPPDPASPIARETADAYVLWALTESGQDAADTQLKPALDLADKCDDPYRLALLAAAALNAGKKAEGRRLLEKLAKLQGPDGRLSGAASITASGPASLAVETTALAVHAWLKLPEFSSQADRAAAWILRQRDASGTFATSQATLLALSALAARAHATPTAMREGKCIVRRAGSAIAEQNLVPGSLQTVTLAGLEGKLLPGENRLSLELTGDNKMPYLLTARWHSPKPPSDPACPLQLSTKLSADKVKLGQPVSLEITLANTTDQGLPMVSAIIGLPAGLEVHPDRLTELKRSGSVDACGVRARELICYWRGIPPKKTISLKLDAAATTAGKYTGPASGACLVYTPERQHWSAPLSVEIVRE